MTHRSRASLLRLAVVSNAVAFLGLAIPSVAAADCTRSVGSPTSCAYCDDYWFYYVDPQRAVSLYGGRMVQFEECQAYCDTPRTGRLSNCTLHVTDIRDYLYYPGGFFNLAEGCQAVKISMGNPPAEVCGNGVDEDCDGVAEACAGCPSPSGTVSVGQTASCTVGSCSNGSTTCRSDGTWSPCQCVGCTNPVSPIDSMAPCSVGQCTSGSMACGKDGQWSACSAPSDCVSATQPPGSLSSDPTSIQAQLDQMNSGCPNGDWGGYDPIQLPLKSASTLPFTDFEVTVLRSLGVTRTYSSSDVMAGNASSASGIFGLGWHHNWETALTCGGNGASCTVDAGAGGRMKFQAQATTVVGVGALSGEALVLYRRTEAANVASGGNNLMVRRPNGEFILFQLDGSELHFAQPVTCGSCMDGRFNGTLRLSHDVDPAGRILTLDFTVGGKLLTVTDELGNRLSISPSSTCSGRAGALSYRAGSSGVDSEYVTYAYDPTCQTLKTVVPSNYTAAPGHSPQLRAYDYQSTPQAGLLTKVYNEFNDPVTVFGYDSAKGFATSLVDAQSTLSVTYPQPNQDKVVSSYGSDTFTELSTRGVAGKATKTETSAPSPSVYIGNYNTRNQTWDGQYLVCEDRSYDPARYFGRDTQKRVTYLADFAGYVCSSTPWVSHAPSRWWNFEYGIVKQIAQGVTIGLNSTTKTSQKSVLADQLAKASPSGTSADTFQTSETLDYDPASKTGDPAGYACGTSNAPVGGLVCRKIVDGYTTDANGTPTLQRIGTFFSYDPRGRLIRSVGPLFMVGQAPAGNVDPVEERTYWSDDDPDLMRRGRLHEIKRRATASQTLTTSFETYDVFGPTQVQDPAGNTTIYTRVGSAGRVTRVDTPDGRHTSTRYYDGDLPRLVLAHSGSARRFTYDDKGRLHAIEPLSGDPDTGSVTRGWIETRDHDAAGNTTVVTRADAQGTVRWKRILEYNWNGTVRKDIHPEPGKGYASWRRLPGTLPYSAKDEDHNSLHFNPDVFGRVRTVSFQHDASTNDGIETPTFESSGPGYASPYSGISYDYEPGQEALRNVWNISASTYQADGLIAGYVHDDFGRLRSVTAPTTMTGGPYTYAYDARGNVVQRSGGNSTISYQYDGADRMTKLTAKRTADGSSVEYAYAYDDPSAIGRLHSITEPDRTTTFTYDEVGRLSFEAVAESDVATSLTTEYRYDKDGDLSEVITPAGLDVKYERDPATKDVTEVRNVTSGTKYASNVKHLPAGPVTDLTFAGGATFSQGFNLRYEPIAIASGPLALAYEVSPAGNPTTIGSATYTFDFRSRLSSEPKLVDTAEYAFAFADGSSTSSRTIAASAVSLASGAPTLKYAFGYDSGSNLSAISTYDNKGSSITGTTCLVHDALGRLTAVGPAKVLAGQDARACTTESDLASVTVRFRYDARNRRVARQDGTNPWKYWVFSPDGRPLAENTKPTSRGGAWSTQREYVWLDGRPLAQIEYPGTNGSNEGDVYLVHVDHLGQPRALTSMAGAVVWSSTPRPYGEILEKTAPDPANLRIVLTNLRLPGQYDERLLGSIGLPGPYYNGARWYLPTMARYMELDPVALRGGMNGQFAPDWYGYANQNPLRWTDPGGDIALTVPGAVMGAVFGGLYGGIGAAIAPGASLKTIAAGAVAGVFVGGAFGAYAASGVGALAMIGGLSGAAGSAFGQALSGQRVNGWAVFGAGVGGYFGGALQGVMGLGTTVFTGWAAAGAGNFVGGIPSMAGDLIGTYLTPKRTQEVAPQAYGTPGGWLAAAGCKQ